MKKRDRRACAGFALAVLLALPACLSTSMDPPPKPIPDYPAQGWDWYPLPNSAGGPGRLFSIEDGVEAFQGRVDLEVSSGPTGLLGTAQTKELGTAALEKWFGFDAEADQAVRLKIQYGGARLHEAPRDASLAVIDRLGVARRGWKCVVAAISVTSIRIEFQAADVAALGVEAKLLQAGGRWKNDVTYELVETFVEPVFVFFKSAPVSASGMSDS
ncbi:MAG: hypothetical protein GY711_18845 [bacterium]|nr:hypothetical protein [bacterium]